MTGLAVPIRTWPCLSVPGRAYPYLDLSVPVLDLSVPVLDLSVPVWSRMWPCLVPYVALPGPVCGPAWLQL